MAKILVAAQDTNSVNAVIGAVGYLCKRGHRVSVYSTGPENTRGAFGEVPYEIGCGLNASGARELLKGQDILLTGLSGYESTDGTFIEEAEKMGVRSVGMADRDGFYEGRFGSDESKIPYVIGVMDERCLETLANSLPDTNKDIAVTRARVVGWTTLDGLVGLREKDFDKEVFLERLREGGYEVSEKVIFYGTQNAIIPESPGFLDYEIRVTTESFRVANDLGYRLFVKGHPAERDGGVTSILAENYGHIALPFSACDSKDLMRAADAVLAGKSDLLVEACVLGSNVGGIFIKPTSSEEEGMSKDDIEAHRSLPVVNRRAIPYTEIKEGIRRVFERVTSEDPLVLSELSEQRKRFGVDGRASERLANLVEETLGG
jgi:hypothetical protein